jgi:hypothetical protein
VGPFVAGGFAEASALPFETFPSETAPADKRSAFGGRLRGATARVSAHARVEVDAELAPRGVGSRSSTTTEPSASTEAVAFAGARAKIEWSSAVGAGALGLSAFVREPLRTRCVDVGYGCERLGATVGVVVHGSVAVWRRGTETAATAVESPPP